ncbi:MAG: SsrA-binding protein SmpB [Candidatus Fimenecus sp.]
MNSENLKPVASNRKAYHEYFVLEKYEAGIELFGTEVKSLRAGKANLKDSYCEVEKGELFITGMHISPYENGNIFNKDPYRKRKLLMHKKEIRRLHQSVKEKGLTLIALSVYFKNGKAKLEIGLCKGKKLYDKRETAAKKSASREMDKTLKQQNRF